MPFPPNALTTLLNRRTLLAIPPLATAGLIARSMVGAQSTGMEVRGDCLDEPAVTMLLDFQTGNWDRLPFTRTEDVLPKADWVAANSAELGILLVPPDWTFLNVWANSFSRNGVPEWQEKQMPYPFWAATFIISPDESAAYIAITGALDGTPYPDADELIQLARDTFMGSDDEGRELCALHQAKPGFQTNELQFAFGHRYGSDLMVCRGWALQSSVSGLSTGPGTSFMFEAMIGPRRESEELMKEVFMPILWQQLPKSGGASTPTPTPTPSF